MMNYKLKSDVPMLVEDSIALKETLYLSSIPGFRKSIAKSVKEM